jgi:heme A synthase
VAWLLGIGLLGMLILGASGGVTALGDTLFPAESLAEGFQQKFSPTAHILIRLRLLHPLIAVIVGVYLVLAAAICQARRPAPLTKRLVRLLTGLYLVQLLAGAVNVVLLAPIWLQLLHLLLSDLIWITVVLLANSVLAEPVTVDSSEQAVTKEDHQAGQPKLPSPPAKEPA